MVPSITISPALNIITKNNIPLISPLTRPFTFVIFELTIPVMNAEIPQITVNITSSRVLLSIPVLAITAEVRHKSTNNTISPTINPITIPLMNLNLLNSIVILFKRNTPEYDTKSYSGV